MNKVRAAIIGLGVGEQHIQGFNSHPHAEVVAVCDFSKEKKEAALKKYPKVKFCDSAFEILSDPSINAVSIASYDNYHFEQISTAIKNQKHIFVEKPLCLFEDEAREIRRLLSENTKIKLSSNLILRKSPRFIELRKQLSEGIYGKPYFLEGDYYYGRVHKITSGWRSEMDYYSSTLGGAVHMVDLLLWLTGDSVEEVTASGNNLCTQGTEFRYNDFVIATLSMKSGALMKVTANMGSVTPHHHGVTVFGTKGTFINSFEGAYSFDKRAEDTHPKDIDTAYPGIKKGDLIPSFVDSILGVREAEVSAEEVFKTMSVCFAIERAMATKSKVSVKAL